ncbi:phosphoribosyl-AMP cyclohydrolase [Roseibium denhamense]|uniref:Phosphoribosyl-AMP cyclohydrolase n=1 Tax=Roseibium denhamense TaxID=76305 RepID=A0ABY1N5F5_9HYPH|nr:phosphoribosyl-AMP cyclohydrolase [Roseibium denhamense]MTI04614.1 phosphoribosyl-AMP cyclohydrolase [Roseibium denhamense]SMP00558.1 phosphoribosyl-AMP cyclohydrolase [Roseibium denhamense]
MCDICFSERGEKSVVETGDLLMPKFDHDGLIAAVVTDAGTGDVLMLGYMNAEALKRTIETGEAWYWSRSRQSYWKKGETSGQVQKVHQILTDCDQDALVLKVTVGGNGATCHVGYRSCFFREIDATDGSAMKLKKVEADRVYDPEDVYGKS